MIMVFYLKNFMGSNPFPCTFTFFTGEKHNFYNEIYIIILKKRFEPIIKD